MYNYPGLCDEELMILYVGGDFVAFDELYNRYSKKLYGYIMSRIRKKEEADNIFQELFFKIHKNRETFNPKFSVKAWFFTICHNEIVNYFKRNKAERGVPFDENFVISEGIADEKFDREKYQLVIDEISMLPEEQRKIVEQRFFGQKSSKEISSSLNKSDESVRKIISRVILRLREKFSYGSKEL